jgi:murein endopeptidase
LGRVLTITRTTLLFALLCSGCPSRATATPPLPLYEEVFFTQRPADDAAKAKDDDDDRNELDNEALGANWSLYEVMEEELGANEALAEQGQRILESTLDWRSFLANDLSESWGEASRGGLRHGRLMPDRGPGFVQKSKRGAYGTDETVALMLWAFQRMTELFPGTAEAVVGDLSREGGGRLSPHKSHQTGRDIDVCYYLKNNEPCGHFRAVTPDTMDLLKNWTYMDLLLSTGRVEYILIDRSLHRALYDTALEMGWNEEDLKKLFEAPVGNTPKRGVIRHIAGHKTHFHYRFVCPAKDPECH